MGVFGTVDIYPTPQSLKDKVDEYFERCFVDHYLEKYDRWVPYCIQAPTFSGMARYLGFPSRAALLAYKNKGNPLYEEVINDAKLRIEEYYEGKLSTTKGNAAGLMFALKNNAGWEEQPKKLLGDDNNQLVITWDPTAADILEAEERELLNEAKPKQIEEPVKEKTEDEIAEDEGMVITIGN